MMTNVKTIEHEWAAKDHPTVSDVFANALAEASDNGIYQVLRFDIQASLHAMGGRVVMWKTEVEGRYR